MRSAKTFGLAAAALGVATCVSAQKFPLLTHSTLQGLHFSGGCAQQEWSATPENSMTLILSAFPGQNCVAQLNLENPVAMEDVAGFTFEARGTDRHQTYTLEFLETLGQTTGSATPRFEAERSWEPDALLFRHLRPRWHAKQVNAIRLIASSMPASHGRTIFPLYLRNLQFVSQEAAMPRPARQDETPVSPMVNSMKNAPKPSPLVVTPPAAAVLSGAHSPSPVIHGSSWNTFCSGVILSCALAWFGTLWILRKRRSPAIANTLSPLYELNTRTWKSRRDDENVLHVGGLSRITVEDLQNIKDMGFNSLWLMGLWDVGSKVRAISKRYGADYQGSPYAINDYRVADDLGAEEDLIVLVEHAHSVGLKVIVDFVPNHMGLDSVWLNEHPEFFIHRVLDQTESTLSDSELEKRYPYYFPYRTPSYPEGGRRVPKTIMVAYGKDPYFYPWIDTAQLDYAEPGLRRKMTEVLIRMAKMVDGVRCDMAMLVLREQVKIHRHPEMSWETFNRWMPEEFWPEAIRAAKRVNPSFEFLAETYWSMEGYLQHLGFDYTYNKPLYEAICAAFHSGHAEGLMNFIRLLGSDFLRRGVHFLENHDEERAMNSLGDERQRGAAALLCTLPGIALIHQGQMEGRRERLPVQRVVPLQDEPENEGLQNYYEGLLRATNLSVFHQGRLQVLYSNNPALISFARMQGETKAIVIINASEHTQKGSVFLSPGLRLETGAPYRLNDLFYPMKSEDVRSQPTVRSSYLYAAAPLINQGLYVELFPFDAHIFMLERETSRALAERTRDLLRPLMERRVNLRPASPTPPPVYNAPKEPSLAEAPLRL